MDSTRGLPAGDAWLAMLLDCPPDPTSDPTFAALLLEDDCTDNDLSLGLGFGWDAPHGDDVSTVLATSTPAAAAAAPARPPQSTVLPTATGGTWVNVPDVNWYMTAAGAAPTATAAAATAAAATAASSSSASSVSSFASSPSSGAGGAAGVHGNASPARQHHYDGYSSDLDDNFEVTLPADMLEPATPPPVAAAASSASASSSSSTTTTTTTTTTMTPSATATQSPRRKRGRAAARRRYKSARQAQHQVHINFAVDSIHNSWTYDEAVKHCPTMSPRSTTGLACDKRRYTIPVAQLRAFLRKLRQPAPGATGEDDDTPTKPLQAVDMDAIIAAITMECSGVSLALHPVTRAPVWVQGNDFAHSMHKASFADMMDKFDLSWDATGLVVVHHDEWLRRLFCATCGKQMKKRKKPGHGAFKGKYYCSRCHRAINTRCGPEYTTSRLRTDKWMIKAVAQSGIPNLIETWRTHTVPDFRANNTYDAAQLDKRLADKEKKKQAKQLRRTVGSSSSVLSASSARAALGGRRRGVKRTRSAAAVSAAAAAAAAAARLAHHDELDIDDEPAAYKSARRSLY